MSGATTAALITAGAAIGTTAYSARQQRQAGRRAESAAERARALSQTQEGEQVMNPRRRRRTAQGFDTSPLAQLVGTGEGASGGLLGS